MSDPAPAAADDAAMAALLLDALEGAVACLDAQDRLVYWNPAVVRTFPDAVPALRRGIAGDDLVAALWRAGYPVPAMSGAGEHRWCVPA